MRKKKMSKEKDECHWHFNDKKRKDTYCKQCSGKGRKEAFEKASLVMDKVWNNKLRGTVSLNALNLLKREIEKELKKS